MLFLHTYAYTNERRNTRDGMEVQNQRHIKVSQWWPKGVVCVVTRRNSASKPTDRHGGWTTQKGTLHDEIKIHNIPLSKSLHPHNTTSPHVQSNMHGARRQTWIPNRCHRCWSRGQRPTRVLFDWDWVAIHHGSHTRGRESATPPVYSSTDMDPPHECTCQLPNCAESRFRIPVSSCCPWLDRLNDKFWNSRCCIRSTTYHCCETLVPGCCSLWTVAASMGRQGLSPCAKIQFRCETNTTDGYHWLHALLVRGGERHCGSI